MVVKEKFDDVTLTRVSHSEDIETLHESCIIKRMVSIHIVNVGDISRLYPDPKNIHENHCRFTFSLIRSFLKKLQKPYYQIGLIQA